MQPEAPGPERERAGFPWGRLALVAWILAVLIPCVRTALFPHTRSVYPDYSYAGESWLTGNELYFTYEIRPRYVDQFRYSPLVAALFALPALLPDAVGGVLWRLLSAGVLAGGFAWFCSAVLPGWRSLS